MTQSKSARKPGSSGGREIEVENVVAWQDVVDLILLWFGIWKRERKGRAEVKAKSRKCLDQVAGLVCGPKSGNSIESDGGHGHLR